jgi:hypothetical protein
MSGENRLTEAPFGEIDTRQVGFVAGVGVAEIDDENVGFDLDDTGDEVLESVHQHRADGRVGFGPGNTPEFLLQ